MNFLDIFIIAVIIAAAVLALRRTKKHKGCGGCCENCGGNCCAKESDKSGSHNFTENRCTGCNNC